MVSTLIVGSFDRQDVRSNRAVSIKPNTIPDRLSSSEFLSAVEELGILPEAALGEIRSRCVDGAEVREVSASDLADQLVDNGMLTLLQARRLLVGKASTLTYGRYVLLEHIGTGAMGRVFKARHRLMDRVVALKAILPMCVASKHSVPRFFREMKIVGMLDHPNVVRAYDADQHGGSPYIVMEYLDGEDFEQALRRRGNLPVQEVIECMSQAAWGLAHAHEKGVVHRDIKPTNLFLTSAGVVKILDLGLGAFVGVSNEEVKPMDTDEGFVVGTTDYMSPEQVTGQAVDARTDLFSLGCTMYRLLTGAYAFPGETKADRLVRRVHVGHVPISDIRPDLPVRLAAVLERLLAPSPDDRFSSAVEAAETLEAMIHLRGRQARESRAKEAGKPPRPSPPSTLSGPQPEAPVDWSLVESELASKPGRSRGEPLSARPSTSSPTPSTSSARLNTYRRGIEEEGTESGRSVQQQYRKELIQMNRSLAEERGQDQAEEPPSTAETWLERLGEHLGDFLAEPSASQIIAALLIVTLIVAIAFAVALS
jgi:eukaryotic-like serine/threonine-protein kinase